MRAALFSRPGVCEVAERQVGPPSEGEVMVQVEACGVCGTDAHIYRGGFPARFPLVAGHEFAGVVEEVGAGVSSLRAGDRVTVDPNIPCGLCRPCRRGLLHLCRNLSGMGVTRDGGFATHCVVPARQVYKVPDGMSLLVAAMAEPVGCCVHGMDCVQMRPGEVVLLIGAGMIGLVLLQLALLRGAAMTIVSELRPEKREAAERLGASCVVDPRAEELSARVLEATEGSGVDVAIECVGSGETVRQAIELVGEGGRVLVFGVAPQDARVAVSPYGIYRKEMTITGSFTNPFSQHRALALLASGRVKVEELISHRLALEEVVRGIELLERGEATKVVIEP